jgi:hypothetical protein
LIDQTHLYDRSTIPREINYSIFSFDIKSLSEEKRTLLDEIYHTIRHLRGRELGIHLIPKWVAKDERPYLRNVKGVKFAISFTDKDMIIDEGDIKDIRETLVDLVNHNKTWNLTKSNPFSIKVEDINHCENNMVDRFIDKINQFTHLFNMEWMLYSNRDKSLSLIPVRIKGDNYDISFSSVCKGYFQLNTKVNDKPVKYVFTTDFNYTYKNRKGDDNIYLTRCSSFYEEDNKSWVMDHDSLGRCEVLLNKLLKF